MASKVYIGICEINNYPILLHMRLFDKSDFCGHWYELWRNIDQIEVCHGNNINNIQNIHEKQEMDRLVSLHSHQIYLQKMLFQIQGSVRFMELISEGAGNGIYMQDVQGQFFIRESGGTDYSSAIVLLRNLGERKDITAMERDALSVALRSLQRAATKSTS
jgi:hypothetical protein